MTAHTNRHCWIDATKGLAILLVVFGHVWRGLEAAGLLQGLPEGLFLAVDKRIYAFHMPLFFLLSGLFFIPSLVRKSTRAFVTSRAWRLLYPLVLWTYIFVALKWAAGGAVNTAVDWPAIPGLPIPGVSQFWFLWALFLLQMALVPLKPVLARDETARIALLALLVLGFGVFLIAWPPEVLLWTNAAPFYLCYLILGAALSAFGLLRPWGGPAALGGLVIFALVLALVPFLAQSQLAKAFVAIALCLSLLLALSWAFSVWPGVARPLTFLGSASMIIYLSHTVFAAGLRIALEKVGVSAALPHLLLGLLVGVVCPIVLQTLAARWRLSRWIGA